MNDVISQIRQKLESGILPGDLTFEERDAWSVFKASQPHWNSSDDEINEEQEDKLYQWLKKE